MLFLWIHKKIINHKDTDTELFVWNNDSGATINYNKLKELVNPKKHK